MRDFEEIDAVEALYRGVGSKPMLGRAYELLHQRWQNGAHDRETAFRLLFLAWYSCSEPGYLTGLEEVNPERNFINELFSAVGGEDSEDPEVWFVVSIMAEVAPWCLGDERYWTQVSGRFRERLVEKRIHIEPDIFEGRGAYGDYFAHQARVHAQFDPA